MAHCGDAGGTRTLHPFALPARLSDPGDAELRRGLYVDCETTGFSPGHDAVIELALLPFTYTLEGRVVEVLQGEAQVHRNDPGRPLPVEITHLTGLTDDDVRAERIDVEAASSLIDHSGLVVAHNARFDRPFVERVLPAARARPWACTRAEVGWTAEGFASQALHCLLCAYGVYARDRHRALADCEAGVWLLAQRLPVSGESVLAAMRQRALTPTVRLWAIRAPFESKELLRARGYRFTEAAPAAPRYALPGLWLNEAEIRALLALRELLEKVHPGLLGPHVEPLIDRARALLGAGAGGASSEVTRRVRILHAPRREVRSAEFGTICEALLSRRRTRVVHYSRPRDETLERTLSPQRLVHYRENWYLDAWCHLRNGLRSFALDCVRHAAVVDEPAREISDVTLDRDLGAGYGIFAGGGRPRSAHLRFSAMQARWVADEVWHSRQEGAFDANGRYELKVPYTDPRELVMNILKYGTDVEVLGPPALRSEVAEALRAASALYRADEEDGGS